MPNYKVLIQYDGSEYKGWQIQPDEKTIQGEFVRVLKIISGKRVRITSSGRTDSGVHALAQVANFWLDLKIAPDSMKKALNSLLPPDIRVFKVEFAPDNFNARFHAIEKTYFYRIFTGEIVPPFKYRYVYRHPYKLYPELMREGAKHLIGEHDFTSFTSHPSSKNMVKRVKKIEIIELPEEEEIRVEITANGFLRYMVRIIVGTLLLVGEGKIKPEEVKRILDSKNRELAGPTAPSKGLFLKNVVYPEEI